MDRRLNLLRIILGFTTLCIIIVSSMSFMVHQGEAVIRIRLGKVEQLLGAGSRSTRGPQA